MEGVQEGWRGEIRTWVSKSGWKVHSETIDRAKFFTEPVKLIFGKSKKIVGQ